MRSSRSVTLTGPRSPGTTDMSLDAGLVVYALDLARVSGFYAGVAGLEVTASEPDHVVLRRPGLHVVVHQVPPHLAAGLEVGRPPVRREDSAVKPVFVVPDLSAARDTAAGLGGVVDGPEHEWTFQGCRVCDGHDPEGNVVQLRESAPAATNAARVTLRPVTEEEYDAHRGPGLAEFTAELARAEHRPVDDALRARAESFFPASLTEALAEDGTHVLRVLDAAGTAVGLLWLGRAAGSPATGFVYDVVIDPEHRGRGLGRAAVLAAEDLFRREGCTRVGLNVWGWNDRAADLYRSLGFAVDAMQMSRPLVPSSTEDPT